MKAIIKTIVLLSITMLTVSCADDNEMLTVINPDGSCYREFYVTTLSPFMVGDPNANNPFPIEIDSTWSISWKHGAGKLRNDFPLSATEFDSIRKATTSKADSSPEPFRVYISRNYKSVDEMAETFRLKPSHEWSDLDVQYRFDKKFRLFYTYYNYSETYPKIEHSLTPVDKFMTPEEAGFWFTGTPDLIKGMNGVEIQEYTQRLSEKYNNWIAYNYWRSLYDILTDNYETLGLSIPKEEFASMKDSLFVKIDFDDISIDDNSYIAKKLDELFLTHTFSSFFNAENSPMKNFGERFWDQEFMKYLEKSFTYKLVMPGKILRADRAINQNDTLIWRLTAHRMAGSSYTIQAQSRKTNTWAFVVTAIVVLIAAGSLAMLRK